MQTSTSPFLQGVFAPWRQENDLEYLEVDGKIPENLHGVLLRNGPNPQFDPPEPYHWFNGDGMLHAIYINQGNARYKNRWIRTERFNLERQAGKALFNTNLATTQNDLIVAAASSNTANTNIVAYNRKLLTLNEGASPVSMQLSNLHTLGDYTFEGKIKRRLSAHPRYDQRCGELMTYSYIDVDEKLVYYRLDRYNRLLNQTTIQWPHPVMLHDFINTENYVIFPLFPCTMSIARMQRGETMFMWEGDELPTWFIIADRAGKEIARIETDAYYVYHFGNAYERGDNIIIDAMLGKCTGLMPDRHGKVATRGDSAARLARWTINRKSLHIKLEYLDELNTEFPRFDERFNGINYRYLYAGARIAAAELFDRIICYDLSTGDKQEHHFGTDIPGEPVFVPRSAKEGDGYLLTVVYRSAEDRSDVVILDAQAIADAPLATIKIPHRIPFGFHGNFVAA